MLHRRNRRGEYDSSLSFERNREGWLRRNSRSTLKSDTGFGIRFASHRDEI
jgi:hypothetical protein